jgi:hypothetical protein
MLPAEGATVVHVPIASRPVTDGRAAGWPESGSLFLAL